MTKILLAKFNTVWGVIIRPQSSNSYRHVLSFDTPEIKDQFLNKYVFGDLKYDWKTQLEKQPEIALTWNTASSATFIVSPQDYAGETMHTLLNKDFGIIKDQGRYFFMTLTSKRRGQTVEYSADIDIFFTWDIKREMFNPVAQTEINRAMADRFYKLPNGGAAPITNNYNLFLKSPLKNSESFESKIKDNLVPYGGIEYLKQDYRDHILGVAYQPLNEIELARANDLLNCTKWAVLYRMHYEADTFFTRNPQNIGSNNIGVYKNYTANIAVAENGLTYPYTAIVGLVGYDLPRLKKLYGGGEINFSFANSVHDGEVERSNYNFFGINSLLQDPTLLKTSYNLLPYAPFTGKRQIIPNDNPAIGGIPAPRFIYNREIFNDGRNFDTITLEFNNYTRNPVNFNSSVSAQVKGTDMFFVVNSKDDADLLNFIKPQKVPYPMRNFEPDYERRVAGVHEFEIKKYFFPYRKITLGSPTKNTFDFQPQEFTSNEILLRGDYNYLAEQWSCTIKPLNYQNYLVDGELPSELEIKFNDVTNYSLPTVRDEWEEFIVRNKAQQNANLNGIIAKGLLGGLGILAAPFTGGASALAVGIGGASLAGQSILSLDRHFSQQRDIKNSPDSLQGGGSTLLADIQYKSFTHFLQEYRLPPLDTLLVAEHFYKYGYNWNGQILPIQNVLNSRYYFNYVEIPETYENIILQASSEIKQIINDSLADGLTVWHVRDINTFKGVKNYEYENVEIALIE